MLPVPWRPGDVPAIDGPVILARHEEDAAFRWPACRRRDHCAEQGPVAMRAAAGVVPVAAQAIAAVGGRRLAGGHQRGADQSRTVRSPHVMRRAIIQDRQEPGMHAKDAIDPGGRHVAFGERELNLVEGVQIHLVAAPPPRLQHPEESGLLHIGDGLRQDLAPLALFERTAGEHRRHGAGAGDQLRRMRRVVPDLPDRFHDRPQTARYSAAASPRWAFCLSSPTNLSVDMMSPNVR